MDTFDEDSSGTDRVVVSRCGDALTAGMYRRLLKKSDIEATLRESPSGYAINRHVTEVEVPREQARTAIELFQSHAEAPGTAPLLLPEIAPGHRAFLRYYFWVLIVLSILIWLLSSAGR